MTARHLRETKLTPSDLRAEAQKLIRTGKMPSLADVVQAIRTVNKNPDHVVPVVHDALVSHGGKETMTDLNTLQSAALAFVREVRGAAAQTSRDKQPDVPMRLNRELAVDIIRTERYQHRDELSLILEAREYIRGRLPVRDRAMAVAILLQRDAVCVGLKRITVVGV